MPKRALAVDLGTSSVRAIVFETSGPGEVSKVEGALARRPRVLTAWERGQATFDVEDYFDDLVACLDELEAAGALGGVTDVAVDSQWHSVVALDRHGRPRSDLISWADTRALRPPGSPPAPLASAAEHLRQRTGCAFASMYWTWRVPWLSAAIGGGAGAAGLHYMGLAEYVGLRLLGDPSMSVSMASGTGLLEEATFSWDAEALLLAGLSAAQLPPLAPADWSACLSPAWARRWPSLATAVWHPVIGDGAAANLGVGCGSPGRVAVTVGTSAAVRAVRPARDRSELPARLWRYCLSYDRAVLGAAYSSGGQLYAWALELWEGVPATSSRGGAAGVPEVRYDVQMPVAPGSDGVVVLPWHAGSRPPEPGVPGGKGCVLNLGLTHTGAHIVSAAVEAVCFQLAGGLEAVEAGSGLAHGVVANGGVLQRSGWWRARLAAVLGRAVSFPSTQETTARGAAALALGVEVAGEDGAAEVVLPRPEDVEALRTARRRWEDWYAALLPIAGEGGPQPVM